MNPEEIVILADGDFPASAAALQILEQTDMVVCCDRAADTLAATGREADLIVGDLDSLSPALRERFAGRLRHDCDQESNDLTKAFHAAMEYRPGRIRILGATGRREDHTLANISLLADYQKEAGGVCRIDMISDYGRFEAACGERTFCSIPGQEISIFAFDRELRITSTGLQYPTGHVVFDTLWKASLNKAEGESFTLAPGNDSMYLVYFCNPGL